MSGSDKNIFFSFAKLSGTSASSARSAGLIRISLSMSSSFNLVAMITGAADFPVAMMLTGSPMTSLINSVINCT